MDEKMQVLMNKFLGNPVTRNLQEMGKGAADMITYLGLKASPANFAKNPGEAISTYTQDVPRIIASLPAAILNEYYQLLGSPGQGGGFGGAVSRAGKRAVEKPVSTALDILPWIPAAQRIASKIKSKVEVPASGEIPWAGTKAAVPVSNQLPPGLQKGSSSLFNFGKNKKAPAEEFTGGAFKPDYKEILDDFNTAVTKNNPIKAEMFARQIHEMAKTEMEATAIENEIAGAMWAKYPRVAASIGLPPASVQVPPVPPAPAVPISETARPITPELINRLPVRTPQLPEIPTASVPPGGIATRPIHQKLIEDALNSGNIGKAREIVSAIPITDPYRASMESLIKMFESVKQNIGGVSY
jgi:hypothetical protein